MSVAGVRVVEFGPKQMTDPHARITDLVAIRHEGITLTEKKTL